MIEKRILESIGVKTSLLNNPELIKRIGQTIDIMVASFQKGNKTLFCGNGGSAADAQHLAAELSGRFYFDRPPLPAEACHVNSSFVTAVSNDYSFETAYSRYIRGIGKPGDVLVAISTSGNSANIIKAVEQAKSMGIFTIALTGETGGKLRTVADLLLPVPSSDTPRIQECHILVGHIICEAIEQKLFGHV